jgi:hypothetical protein
MHMNHFITESLGRSLFDDVVSSYVLFAQRHIFDERYVNRMVSLNPPAMAGMGNQILDRSISSICSVRQAPRSSKR